MTMSLRGGDVVLPRGGAAEPLVLLVGLGAAMCLRLAVAGGPHIPSTPSAVVFIVGLLALAGAAGWRPSLPRRQGLLIGAAGAAVLCVGPLLSHMSSGTVRFVPAVDGLAAWGALVVAVAVAEEVLLRGVLYTCVAARHGEVAAVVVGAAAFGLMHAPIYGWSAVPVDVAVGVWLGGLRVAGGGVAAPATAHALADVAAWWLR